jgi:putative sterol carrier protein
MSAIYTQSWYESLKEILNRSDEVTKSAPRGLWHVLAEIRGDGVSPYISQTEQKRFAIVLNDGKCNSYEELSEAPPRKDFEFILQLPASLFERIVANLADPVEAGLKGAIKITGDMRVLIQNAELVNVLSEIYQREVETDWTKGKPPYPGEPAAAPPRAAGAAS